MTSGIFHLHDWTCSCTSITETNCTVMLDWKVILYCETRCSDITGQTYHPLQHGNMTFSLGDTVVYNINYIFCKYVLYMYMQIS